MPKNNGSKQKTSKPKNSFSFCKPLGRPRAYKSPEQMQTKIDQYFQECAKQRPVAGIDKRGNYIEVSLPEVPTIGGLALYLGIDMANLSRYGEREGFRRIVTCAKNKCGQILNQLAILGMVDSKIAALNLSANHGMVLKTAIEADVRDNRLDDGEVKALKSVAGAIALKIAGGQKVGAIDISPSTKGAKNQPLEITHNPGAES